MESSPPPSAQPMPPEAMLEAEYRTVRSGANWFYWIAALSLANTVLLHSGANFQFHFGLALTQLADVVMAHVLPGAKWFSIIFGLGVGGVLVFCGWKARQTFVWAFVLGLTIFLLDCGLFGWIVLKFGPGEGGAGIVGVLVRGLALYWFFLGSAPLAGCGGRRTNTRPRWARASRASAEAADCRGRGLPQAARLSLNEGHVGH